MIELELKKKTSVAHMCLKADIIITMLKFIRE